MWESDLQKLSATGVRSMIATIAILGVIVVSFLVGSLTSSVETETSLPHRY